MDGERFIPEFLGLIGSLGIALRFQTHCSAGPYIAERLKNPTSPEDERQHVSNKPFVRLVARLTYRKPCPASRGVSHVATRDLSVSYPHRQAPLGSSMLILDCKRESQIHLDLHLST